MRQNAVTHAFSSLRGHPAAWVAARTARERILLAAVVLLAAGSLCYTQVWRPLAGAREAALASIAHYEDAIERVRSAAPGLSDRPAGAALPAPTAIATSAPEFGLSIQRVEPEGSRIRVMFDRAIFEYLLNWLARLETEYSLKVVGIELTRLPEPGTVSARVTLEP